MAMFAWGLDEIAEAIGLFYVFIVGLLILLVAMERNLDAEPMPQLQLVANGSMVTPTSILARYRSG